MMKAKDAVSPRQLIAAAFVGLLSPLIRRFPRVLAETAGRSAWLSIPAAALLLIPVFLLARLLFRKSPGASYGEVLTAALGNAGGRGAAGLYALWLLFYAGFLLRSGAVRFITTIYQGAGPGVFVVCMALLCGIAAAGPFRTVARSAMLLRPLLAAVPALLFLLTLKDASFGLLLPVTAADLAPNALAGLEIANLLSVCGYFAFLRDRVEGPLRLRDCAGWAAGALALLELMTCACLGSFGPELTAKMTYPFFMLARDASLTGSLERFEPLVVAVWVFADFIFLSALLHIAAGNLRACFAPGAAGTAWWPAVLCAALAGAAALLLPGDTDTFTLLSDRLVPLATAVMTLGIPLVTLVVGKLRKRI